MVKLTQETIEQLCSLAQLRKSVLITGGHGVGKSEVFFQIMKRCGIKNIKYYSCATIDPWVDFVGIPTPDQKSGTLKFWKLKDLMEAEVLGLDEINRTHDKVQNAMLEAIQFKTINGVPMPKLKMVWAMQNPATKLYKVNPIDPPLKTRFEARITISANPNPEYFHQVKKIPQKVAEALTDWWNDDLNDELRELVTPRDLEHIGLLIKDKMDWKFCLGDDLGVPLYGLDHRLSENCGMGKYDGVTLRRIVGDLESYSELAANDKDFAIHVVNEATKARTLTCWDAAEVITALPQEFLMKLMTSSVWVKKMLKQWSELDSSFHDCEECKNLHTILESSNP
jgi:hypothetical protein